MTNDDSAGPPSGPWSQVLLALAFLTRLPIRLETDAYRHGLAPAMWAFPVVGALVGLSGGAVYALAHRGLPPLAAAALALAATAILTGALHEDGLADLADGVGGGKDREAKLLIMRDSRIGTYGAMALVLTLAMRLGAVSGLSGSAGLAVLTGAHAVAQAMIPAAMRGLSPARADGLGKGAGIPSGRTALMALALGTIIAATALPLPGAGAALAGAILGGGAVVLLARRQLGGFTGDVLGAVQQAALTLGLLGAVAAS